MTDTPKPPRAPLHVFAPYGRQGASVRVRVLDWLDATDSQAELHLYAGLASNSPGNLIRNIGSVGKAELATRRIARRSRGRVLIHRDVSPFTSGGLPETIVNGADLSVFDFDDAIMWTPRSGAQIIWSRSKSCLRTVRSVDRVLAGNEILADWAAQFNGDVKMIPSCVRPDDYAAKPEYDLAGSPRLVWIGSPTTEPNITSIGPALLQIHRLTGARLTVMSSGRAPLGEVDRMIDRVAWSPAAVHDLCSADIAIAPQVDGVFQRGKCAYKVLQYGASGLPTVVSPVGANRKVAADLRFPLAESQQDWVDALLDLIRSAPSDRSAMGRGARTTVEARYSFAAWSQAWLSAVGETRAAPDRR